MDENISIPVKPYVKGQYWMITTIPMHCVRCDNYALPGPVQVVIQ